MSKVHILEKRVILASRTQKKFNRELNELSNDVHGHKIRVNCQ